MTSPVMDTPNTTSDATMTFAEIIPKLLDGKKIRREHWGEDICAYMEMFPTGSELVVRMPDSRQLHSLKIMALDLEADDWSVVREN